MTNFHGTTILAVRRGHDFALGGDGQVTLGNIKIKGNANKIRKLHQGKIIAGFAGGTADAFTLFERFEAKLADFQDLKRAAVELAKDWRSDRMLRRLEAMLLLGDANYTLLLSGAGDVLEPEQGVIGIGSGGAYAQAAGLALLKHSALPAEKIVEESLSIAASLCIYTNHNFTIASLSA